jgi:lysophospholipase L1-like esterase
MPSFCRVLFLVASLSTVCAGPLFSQSPTSGNWVGSWASSQQVPESTNELSPQDLTDVTLRQIVHLSAGGSRVRIRLSNAFGLQPLTITGVHIARAVGPGKSGIDDESDHALAFGGSPAVIIPAGADYWSDAVDFPVDALSNLAVTMHLENPPHGETSHPGSHATSFLVHGTALSARSLENAKTFEHWFFLSGVDVTSNTQHAASVVILGDSITDGHGSTTDGNNRWPDFLAERLQSGKQSKNVGLLNEGIGGNHMLIDGLGPNALARFDRDVLAQTGVSTLFLLEGINDLGYLARMPAPVPASTHSDWLHQLQAAYSQVVERAHAHGIRVVAATILPDVGSDYYHPGPENEADREALNAWIRTPGHFDAVVDFDRVTADPKSPERLLPAYDSGDHLHPSPKGYKAMADAISLALLKN